ncbi:nucleolar protein 58-like [Ischnura elegans]|uniref:nucleolar protein 58-like n=1 Tax=Ischnura elegans TaxID=197161 RepID=UPI001ED88979|nr:nucleolar protein 58-like [Ischnura elegans]
MSPQPPGSSFPTKRVATHGKHVGGLRQDENLGCSWSHEDTLLLLEVYREKEGAFRSKRHDKVWEEIGEAISSKAGLAATGRQCQAKISGLKRTYKEVRTRKAKPGNGSCYWRYLEVMDSIFGEKAWVDAPATAGSEGPPPPKNLTTSPGTSKKRKVEGVLEELLGEWRNEREEKRDEERRKRREEKEKKRKEKKRKEKKRKEKKRKEKKREEKKLEEQKRLELKEKKLELMSRKLLIEEQKLAMKGQSSSSWIIEGDFAERTTEEHLIEGQRQGGERTVDDPRQEERTTPAKEVPSEEALAATEDSRQGVPRRESPSQG